MSDRVNPSEAYLIIERELMNGMNERISIRTEDPDDRGMARIIPGPSLGDIAERIEDALVEKGLL